MLYERWCHVAAEQSHRVALRDLATGRQWTFGGLHAAGDTYDCGNGEIVYPQGHTPEFILTLLNAWRTGRVACPLETGQTPPVGRAVLPRVPADRQVSPPVGLPPDIVHLKTTSATTGAARYAAFTANQLAADVENIVTTMGLRADWPNLGVISMAHSYGFSNLVLPLLLHGIPLILVESPLPEAVRRAAASEKSVTLAAVPALWRAWLEADSIPTNVKLAISAGAPLPPVLEQDVFMKHGLKIHNFYGSTECGGIAYDATHSPRNDEACVGSPMQNVDLSVNEHGCLVVNSRAVGESYWPSPAETLGNGRFETADLVEISLTERGRSPSASRGEMVGGNNNYPAMNDVPGAASRDGSRSDIQVFLRGRVSDLINVAGRKVSPATIERELIQHPAVGECLVFGVQSRESERGDLIVACVVASSPVTSEALKQFLLDRIPAWQIPRHWWFVESLLRNRVGKISRAGWRAKFVQERANCV